MNYKPTTNQNHDRLNDSVSSKIQMKFWSFRKFARKENKEFARKVNVPQITLLPPKRPSCKPKARQQPRTVLDQQDQDACRSFSHPKESPPPSNQKRCVDFTLG